MSAKTVERCAHRHLPLSRSAASTTGQKAGSDRPEMTTGLTTAKGDAQSPQEEESSSVYLDFALPSHPEELLDQVNGLRKNNQFCDVTLLVGNHEIPAHKAVLASSSRYLLEMLTKGEEATLARNLFRLRDFDSSSFDHLVNFMYTGRLHIPKDEVKAVYETARKLKMDSAMQICADFLAANLSSSNCLDVRSSTKDVRTKDQIDSFIQSHVMEVTNVKEFTSLPRLQVKVIGADESLLLSGTERNLFDLVLHWVKSQMGGPRGARLDALLHQVNVLYLGPDNTLRDCQDVDDSSIDQEEIVQDYKKMKRRQSCPRGKEGANNNGTAENAGPLPFHKFSIQPRDPVEKEWSIIAFRRTEKNTYISLAMLGDQLAAISMQVRVAQTSSPYSSSGEDPDSPVLTPKGGPRFANSGDRNASLIPLAQMSSPRCGYGLAVLDSKLVIMGGYDRGECLKSVEAYDLKTNTWSNMADMRVARARCDVTVVNGCIYVCAGSDGVKEYKTMERFNPATGTWENVADLLIERQWPGVAGLGGKIYCVGGQRGQKVLNNCEVYDPETDTWSAIAPLTKARYQCAVCTYEGRLYAIGGTGSWNCLNSVEVYDPKTDKWEMIAALNGARRGAGVGVLDGKLYVLGGNDGSASLMTTEVLDMDSEGWTLGPRLSIPRANISATVFHGRLFTAGGFTGKKFLNTLEYLDMESNEWCCFLPAEVALASPHPLTNFDLAASSAAGATNAATTATLDSVREAVRGLSNGAPSDCAPSSPLSKPPTKALQAH